MDWTESVQRLGFAVIEGLLEAEAVDRLIDALSAVGPSATALSKGDGVYAMRNLLDQVPETRRLAESAPALGLVEAVLGPGAFVVRGLLFDKTPEANWTVPWHQDLSIAVRERTDAPGYGPWTRKGGVLHVQPPVEVLERMLTVRVQLDDCDGEGGPLRVLPGSHAHAGSGPRPRAAGSRASRRSPARSPAGEPW